MISLYASGAVVILLAASIGVLLVVRRAQRAKLAQFAMVLRPDNAFAPTLGDPPNASKHARPQFMFQQPGPGNFLQ